MKKRKVLITGGNGYVGREATRLLYPDHDVCVVDCLRYGTLRFSDAELSKFRFSNIDIADPEMLGSLISDFDPDTIIHLAAIHYIPECENSPLLAARTNILGTINIGSLCPADCRLVFASSGAVYQPELVPHCEKTSPIGPSDVYGFTKLHGEQYVRYFSEKRKLSAVNVRLFNVVGPGETNPHLVPEIIAQLKAGRTAIRLGNVKPRRDYIHVLDAARGFVDIALKTPMGVQQCIEVNLGTGTAYSVQDVISKLQGITNAKVSIEMDPARVRSVDRPFLAANITKAQELFGWRPQRSLDDALSDLWKNPDLAPELLAKYA